MKTKSMITSLVACGFFTVIASAQEPSTRTETTIEENPDGSVTETTRTTTFTPEVRQKVVTYFEPYASERFGLPAELATRIKVEKIPATWRTSTLAPGVVIEKEVRPLLVPAPDKLVTLFPNRPEGHSYYIAGSNVVVVDSEYRVVDSVRIPTIQFEVEAE